MDDRETLITALRDRLQDSEFYRWAGVEVVDASPGVVEIAFEANPQHLNLQGLVHGGILATLADTAMGLAVRTVLEPGRRHVTVQLGIEFLSAVWCANCFSHGGNQVVCGTEIGSCSLQEKQMFRRSVQALICRRNGDGALFSQRGNISQHIQYDRL